VSVLEVRKLRVLGTHGVLESEKRAPQPFEIDLDIYYDMTLASISDALDDAVDYGAAVDAAVAVIQGPHCELLERLALLIGEATLAVDARIEEVDIVVRKLEPPVPYEIGSSGVRLNITR
jgi:dihydroneopterin aldolase